MTAPHISEVGLPAGGRASPHPPPTSALTKMILPSAQEDKVWRWIEGKWVLVDRAEVQAPVITK